MENLLIWTRAPPFADLIVMIADAANGVNWIWVLLCFGALVIPLVYMVLSRFRGRCNREMLIGAGIQIVLTLVICGLSELDYRLGNMEAYAWVFVFPVLNVVALIYYSVIMGRSLRTKHEKS